MSEPRFREEQIAAANRELATAPPQTILRWAVETFGQKLTMATAFGAEGCCLIHMLAEIEPGVRIFNLETGYQFPETLELRERIKRTLRHRGRVHPARADRGGVRGGARRAALRACAPTSAATTARSLPLRQAVVGYEAWISAIRKRPDAGPGGGRRGPVGREVRPGEGQPAAGLDEAATCGASSSNNDVPVQPAARPGLSEHRLLALHAAGRRRRGRARRPLGRHQVKKECGLHVIEVQGGAD